MLPEDLWIPDHCPYKPHLLPGLRTNDSKGQAKTGLPWRKIHLMVKHHRLYLCDLMDEIFRAGRQNTETAEWVSILCLVHLISTLGNIPH